MRYYYEKNGQIYSTQSIDELIYNSFPTHVQSPEKIAHYKAVAPVIFSPEYKGACSVTTEEFNLGQDFIDFIANHKLTSATKYNGVDLLYLLSLSHDTALRTGVWRLGSQSHLKASQIISNLLNLETAVRVPLMKESIAAWKELFLDAQIELHIQETGASPDSTRSMLSQLSLYSSAINDKKNGQSQSDLTRLEMEQEQLHLLEMAYYKRKQEKKEIESYSYEDDEYQVSQPQYSYN
ncbi:hypothetical protein OQJ18_13550 [Fluoribacter dumoffii]|uniref:hypothetical protein n=1 Tax=Fluoribacter dumoffii TaxID=463 RepID=UPI002244488E|nr:hypothetical protein [Fluoribacter dumoffii]MCW8416879.1 hypothetical protein [Fluoribacter dumoffii]MCW8455281.1 hypothetical protein [Fluoribacter dumoffii]MCW8460641.1 hypothetical protein [Fluoribacter dumoffii]MCW8484122.1 hypothetical protein [Fluoribacter dumoffii]